MDKKNRENHVCRWKLNYYLIVGLILRECIILIYSLVFLLQFRGEVRLIDLCGKDLRSQLVLFQRPEWIQNGCLYAIINVPIPNNQFCTTLHREIDGVYILPCIESHTSYIIPCGINKINWCINSGEIIVNVILWSTQIKEPFYRRFYNFRINQMIWSTKSSASVLHYWEEVIILTLTIGVGRTGKGASPWKVS